ncbi:MAG: Dam family site-specific DNA-(adenine-N6)-methyltransferase, partial [Mycoplasmataceae bacterium]|nr:Dam family site-specific DNA-(adenine-N6)-methyltransferase [Mycoplasmataceae bacterium]
ASKVSYKRFRELLLILEAGHYVLNDYDDEKQKMRKISPFYKVIASIDRNESGSDRLLSLKDATKEFRAARFLFLNKNNFNGLYRVNGSGFYNSPSKHLRTKTFDEDNIKELSKYLDKSVTIYNNKFAIVARKAVKGDFVYFDPPYDYEEGTSGFDSYQKDGFGRKGQKELLKLCKELDKKGVKFLVSNHPTIFIKDLYKDFDIRLIDVQRSVGGKGSERKIVKEVLIKNYEN